MRLTTPRFRMKLIRYPSNWRCAAFWRSGRQTPALRLFILDPLRHRRIGPGKALLSITDMRLRRCVRVFRSTLGTSNTMVVWLKIKQVIAIRAGRVQLC